MIKFLVVASLNVELMLNSVNIVDNVFDCCFVGMCVVIVVVDVGSVYLFVVLNKNCVVTIASIGVVVIEFSGVIVIVIDYMYSLLSNIFVLLN